jgi:hypothetical protein
MKPVCIHGILLIMAMLMLTSCSGVDINDEAAVIKDIQGTWTGYEIVGDTYRHIKVNFRDNTFEGWLQTSDSPAEPLWNVLPNENGNYSLGTVLEHPEDGGKYRSFNFVILKRCCGDNSITAKTLSKLITYQEIEGLRVNGLESTKQ